MWLEVANVKTGSVWRAVDKWDWLQGPLTRGEAVNLIVKRLATTARLPHPDRYTGHSLRAGFVTVAAEAGASDREIARQTGHAPGSRALHRYIRHATTRPAPSTVLPSVSTTSPGPSADVVAYQARVGAVADRYSAAVKELLEIYPASLTLPGRRSTTTRLALQRELAAKAAGATTAMAAACADYQTLRYQIPTPANSPLAALRDRAWLRGVCTPQLVLTNINYAIVSSDTALLGDHPDYSTTITTWEHNQAQMNLLAGR